MLCTEMKNQPEGTELNQCIYRLACNLFCHFAFYHVPVNMFLVSVIPNLINVYFCNCSASSLKTMHAI